MPDIIDVIEEYIAPSLAEEMVQRYNPYEVSWLQGYAYELGAASDRPDLDYRAYVIPGEIINAVAIPGGNVYIYEGALQHFDKPIIAGIVGHEISHIAKRHCMYNAIGVYGMDLLISLFGQSRQRELADLFLKIIWRSYGREEGGDANEAQG